MKIVIIGGGPAGLYFGLLMKKADPSHDITIYERNKPDDTFGFGVVFSDETLGNLKTADPDSYAAILDQFAYWDEIEVHFRGQVVRSGGHGFCGISRVGLLNILQRRCAALGVNIHYQSEVHEVSQFADADLIVVADGVNSRIRERYQQYFRPQFVWGKNKFVWLGSAVPLSAFTFIFKENAHGIWNVHAYRFKGEVATWIIETTEESWRNAGLEHASEQETVAYLEHVFAEELRGRPLLTNKSVWRSFPTIRNERWHYQNLVLIGDAAHTAHFSVGSGTKLAMEDAIALCEAVQQHPRNTTAALDAYEEMRREEVEKTQHAATVSLAWFEHVRRFWHMDPIQFNFSLLSRSKQLTYEKLKLRDPGLIRELDRWFAHKVCMDQGFEMPTVQAPPPMFMPFRLRGLVLQNRVVVSPMCQYCADDGTPNDWHFVHLGSRAVGGAGLVVTEMANVSREARITPGCAGMYKEEHRAAWKRIVDFVHTHSQAKICLQLGHAGRKGSTRLMWEGMDEPLPEGNWPLISASPIPYFPYSQVPREMTRADMDEVREHFVRAARMGEEAGFDMLELHMAHGYLLSSFISPLTNIRRDEYGGSLENRLRFPLEVFDAVRAVWPDHKPMSVRISATDWVENGGLTGDDAVEIAKMFKAHGCDIIDVSAGQTTPDAKPVYGRMFQTPFSEQIRNEAGIATIAVGNITTADQVNTIIASGRADLCALARPHLTDPHFTLRAAAHYGYELQFWPNQYLSGKQQAMVLAERANQEEAELRAAARPPKPQTERTGQGVTLPQPDGKVALAGEPGWDRDNG